MKVTPKSVLNFCWLSACLLLSSAPLSNGTVVGNGTFSNQKSQEHTISGLMSASDLAHGRPVIPVDTSQSNAPLLVDGKMSAASYALSGLFLHGAASFPRTYTITLDTTTHPGGFDITSIRTFAGMPSVPQRANQIYSLAVATVATPTIYNDLGEFTYQPIPSNANSPALTQLTISDDAGALVGTGIASIQITFKEAIGASNYYYELDVHGFPTGSTPELSVEIPSERRIVQRDASNKGVIPVSGVYTGSPDSIEARLVVSGGADDNGTTTTWQTIDASPTLGSFSGSLTNVAAGGWYTLEVRQVVSGTPGTVTTVEKIAVGDIYLMAGQSNSTNSGSPKYTPVSDRVVTLNSYGGALWRHAYDPQPLTGLDTNAKASHLSRLGDLLIAETDIPVGFVSVGVGGSPISTWLPVQRDNGRLRGAVESFPVNGFRAFMWHQGETNTASSTTKAAYKADLVSVIADSRAQAGWAVPWYISEASYTGGATLTQQYPITAAQREVAFEDPNTQLGAYTDFFSWETADGGKLHDTVHFNGNGLLAHAQQWKEILLGMVPHTMLNGNFESTYDPALSLTPALADGATNVIDFNLGTTKPPTSGGPIVPNHWRITQASDDALPADGSNGLFNPDNSSYADSADSTNSGEAPNMSERHVAFLSEGTAGNSFLQTTRALLKPNRKYTLIAALGVRDNSDTYGDAKLEILANGTAITSSTFTEADLDNVQGGNAKGKFTLMRTSFMTSDTLTPAIQEIGIRISKTTGAGTYIDFDNVQLTETDPLTYEEWQIQTWGSNTAPMSGLTDDPDGDGLSNGIEYTFGTSPTESSTSSLAFDGNKLTLTWRKPELTDAVYTIQQSTTLANGSWVPATALIQKIVSTSGDFETVEITQSAGWVNDPETKTFIRLSVATPSP